jgi:hypothetical protein
MASFGDGVSALIETYTKCLRLLKAFGGSDRDSVGLASSEVQLLRSTIRSDRAKVRRVYSSSLSANGKRLEEGDCKISPRIRPRETPLRMPQRAPSLLLDVS